MRYHPGHLSEICVLLRGHAAAAQVVIKIEAERAVVAQRPDRLLCMLRLLQDLLIKHMNRKTPYNKHPNATLHEANFPAACMRGESTSAPPAFNLSTGFTSC